MRTFAELETYIQNVFNDTSAKTQTLLRIVADDVYRNVRRKLNLPYRVQQIVITSLTSTASYDLPIDYRMIADVKITIAGVDYFPRLVPSRDQWNALTSGTSSDAESDIPVYARIIPAATKYRIEFYPTLSSAGNDITINYFAMARSLVADDFADKSTSTVSITNGSKDVTGAATVFAATDVGRYIRFDSDGYWYRVAVFVNNLAITLDRDFEGTTVAGDTYLIGTVPALPPEAMDIMAKFILQTLWEKREDATVSGGKATYYETRAKQGLKDLKKTMEELYDSPDVTIIDRSQLPLDPNDYPLNIG